MLSEGAVSLTRYAWFLLHFRRERHRSLSHRRLIRFLSG
jgi:hypothetical protein